MSDTSGFDNIGGEQEETVKHDAVIADGSELDKQLDDLVKETGRDDGTDTRTQRGTTTQDTQRTRTQEQEETTQRGQRGQQRQPVDGTEDTTRTTQDRPIQQTPRQYGSLFRTDTTGAVFSADGRKIANSGIERRVFDRVHSVYNGIETERDALRQRVEAMESANQAAKDAGLNIEEQAASLRLMAAWKTDKLKTINFLLTQATQAGIDVSSIRAGGVDMAAFERALETRLQKALEPFQPFVEQSQHQAELQQAQDQAAQDIAEFMEESPEARLHENAIAAIMQHTGRPMRESYLILQVQAAKNGWDMSKPLQAQAAATVQRQRGGGRAPTGGGNQRLPSFNGRDAGNGVTVEAGTRGPADVGTSYDDIINDVFREHGNIQ